MILAVVMRTMMQEVRQGQSHISIIDDLLFNCLGNLPPFILLVTQLCFKAGLANGLLDGFVSKTVRRTCRANHVFFNHNAAKIVGASMQTQLSNLPPYREP